MRRRAEYAQVSNFEDSLQSIQSDLETLNLRVDSGHQQARQEAATLRARHVDVVDALVQPNDVRLKCPERHLLSRDRGVLETNWLSSLCCREAIAGNAGTDCVHCRWIPSKYCTSLWW